MGKLVTEDGEVTYRQKDGEITAWLPEGEEKMELTHIGSPLFKKILYFLVFIGMIYLGIIFIIY